MSWNLPLFRAVLLLLLLTAPAHALRVEELAPDQEWHVGSLKIEGNEQIATSELVAHLVTKTRPWYTPWRGRPVFDPVTFTADLERLVRFYRAQGFYQAELSYNLEV